MNKNILAKSFYINDYSNLLLKYSKFGIYAFDKFRIYTFKIIHMMLKYKNLITFEIHWIVVLASLFS